LHYTHHCPLLLLFLLPLLVFYYREVETFLNMAPMARCTIPVRGGGRGQGRANEKERYRGIEVGGEREDGRGRERDGKRDRERESEKVRE